MDENLEEFLEGINKVRQEAREAWDIYRASMLTDILNSEKHFHYTPFMIHYTENKSFSEQERESNLLRTIAELTKNTYEKNKDNLHNFKIKTIEKTLACAKQDIENKDYWAAIMDIASIEENYLQEYIPNLPNLEHGTAHNLFLAKKLLKGMGGIEIEQKKPQEPKKTDGYDDGYPKDPMPWEE